MVGACQQNSGIFLVRGGEAGQGWQRNLQGPGEAAGKSPGQAAGSERDACGCRGWAGRDADDQITGAGGGLGARRRGVPRLGWQWNL